MNNITILIMLGILGVLGHCLMKADSLIKDAKVGNVPFTVLDYVKTDWIAITLSFLSIFVWFFLFEEVAVKYPSLQGFTRVSFFLMGLVGSYFLQTIFSKAKAKIRAFVDEKTNELDEIKMSGVKE